MGVREGAGFAWKVAKAFVRNYREAGEEEAARRTTVDGEKWNDVYVYDPRPVMKMRKGDRFELECLDRDLRMRSTVTGTVWDSAVNGDVPVAYRGRPIGFLSGRDACRKVRELQAEGRQVFLDARCTSAAGKRGYPLLSARG